MAFFSCYDDSTMILPPRASERYGELEVDYAAFKNHLLTEYER